MTARPWPGSRASWVSSMCSRGAYGGIPTTSALRPSSSAPAIRSEIESSLGRPPAALRSDSSQAAHAFAAYDLYLRGMYDLNKRRVPDLEAAVRYFQEATNRDPQYARAYAALADAYALLGGYSALPPQALYAKARAAAQ